MNNAASSATAVPLFIQTSGNKAVLIWNNPACTLQAAPAATGTYTNVNGATSPFTNTRDAPAKFFRLVH